MLINVAFGHMLHPTGYHEAGNALEANIYCGEQAFLVS